MTTITLNGDYGYTAYRYNGGTATAIDATNASWIVANTGSTTNIYPFLVDNANTGIKLFGATINGKVSLTGEWLDLYVNSAAFMVRDTEQAEIYDIRISKAWDGIRVAGASDGFVISDVWLTDIRDDAFENDNPSNGTIRNSMFDGVFSGISLGHKNMADSTNKVLELDGVLIRMESFLFKGQMTHQSPFKMESKSPMLRIKDSVIAIDNVNHIGDSRLQLAWDKTIESSGNVFLNLSDKPLPSDYPMPPSGWTILQGQDARDYWDEVHADFVAGDAGADAPEVPTETTETTDVTDNDAVGTIVLESSGDPVKDDAPASESEVTAVQETADTTFLFDAIPESSAGIKVIDKFVQGTDKIILDSSVFTSLNGGDVNDPRTLDKAFFEVAARADDYNDHIMYKWKTGELFYDADGRGGQAQVKIGQLDDRMSLTHTDFLVIDFTSKEQTVDAPEVTVSTYAEAGGDTFVFDAMPRSSSGVQIVDDFTPDTDKIVLDSSVFTSLRGGSPDSPRTLDQTYFEVAARADDYNDHIMYKWKTGELFYDEDGRGGAPQVLIGQLDDRLALDHTDFLVI